MGLVGLRPVVGPGGSRTRDRAVARKKTSKTRVSVKQMISGRLREIRQELFGEHGGPELARRLSLPARTWYNYETGVTVPAEVLLGFLEQTGTNPLWLFNGGGPKYSSGHEDQILSTLSPEDLIRRGLEKLERQPGGLVVTRSQDLPGEGASDFIAVGMVPLAHLAGRGSSGLDGGYILAYRHWLPHPSRTVAARLDDDSMHPILSAGSVVAIDRAVTDPEVLQGKLVAANPDGRPMIRWLEVSGKHLILRPNFVSAEYPTIPIPRDEAAGHAPILGQVVWSWSRFSEP